jgi:hypothetical protein
MINYIQNSDIDEVKWNLCISSDPQNLIYGWSWYSDVIAGKNWDALILGDYEAVMPLCYKKKWGLYYLYRPIGAQQLGIFSPQKLSPELIEDFIHQIPNKFIWKDLFFNVENDLNLVKKGKLISNINVELDLNKTYEELQAEYSTQTKRNLKKARRIQLQQFNYDQIDILIHLFKNHKGKDLRLTDDYYQRMKHVMYVAQYRGFGQLHLLYDETQTPIAGVFTLEFMGRITLIFTAVNHHGKEVHAMTYLIDELISFHSNQGKVLDFEGSNIPSLRDFYLGFGGQVKTYFNWRHLGFYL